MTAGTRSNDELSGSGIQRLIKRKQHKFDTEILPADVQRVYGHLKNLRGEEYALTFVFIFNTAVELHRAWHVTLLTSRILQQVADKCGVRMTWSLGVIQLKFQIEDGTFEIHRKVPYDYDSEYQDMYMRIAVALGDGEITVNEALNYQAEVKKGLHTAKTGLFLRDYPGRLVLYPLLALTCTVIFFGGDWNDAGVAALCGVACGLVEYLLSEGIGGEATMLIDIVIGTITGVIGSLFYRYGGERYCLSSIFLGNLYWYFYGTAFVIGLLEIMAGELETGVTRFIAVSVKTFVLCLGASLGMLMTLPDASESWHNSNQHCGCIELDEQPWRIPLYLLCSAAALGQYRFPVLRYWRGLAVQLVGYEVQYVTQRYFGQFHTQDNLDTSCSNIVGAAAAVCAACFLSWIVDQLRYYYYGRLLQNDDSDDYGAFGNLAYNYIACVTNLASSIGLETPTDAAAQKLSEKIKAQSAELADPNHPRRKIELTEEEERMTVDIIVDAQDHNIWSILMPAVYQLVPGSIIARLWFNQIFPPPLLEDEATTVPGNYTYKFYETDPSAENVFSNLFVTSTSLALGLMLGFALVQTCEAIFCGCGICSDTATDIYGGAVSSSKKARKKERVAGMYTTPDVDPPQQYSKEKINAQEVDVANPVIQNVLSEETKEEEKEGSPLLPQEDSA